MTKTDMLSEYAVNEYGRITSPGKFEGEPLYAVHYWDLAMQGLDDETIYDCGKQYSYFLITVEDVELFPTLKPRISEYARLFEDDSGFVHCQFATQSELDEHLEDAGSEDEAG